MPIADAADATGAAIEHGKRGVYNVVDDAPAPIADWLPALADKLGAKRPTHLPRLIARPLAGEAGVAMMTEIRGASNAKAKRELAWSPEHPSWRQGFIAARPIASDCSTSCGQSRSRSPIGCSAASPKPRTWSRRRC